MKQRNATIELMRFLFASSIIFFHIAGTLWDRKLILFSGEEFKLTLFRNGYIGVEFFFLVSGFLMAKSIYRRQSQACIGKLQPEPVGVETIRFLWGKVKALWPYYLPACAIGCLLFLLTKENLHPGWFVPYLPSLFFLQETGLSDASFTGLPSWYISSMLIAMAVLYPICRKFYFSFTSLFGLLLGILMTGALIQLNGNLAGTGQDWWAITFACNFRALGEIALGTVCYEASRRLSQISFSTGRNSFRRLPCWRPEAAQKRMPCPFSARTWVKSRSEISVRPPCKRVPSMSLAIRRMWENCGFIKFLLLTDGMVSASGQGTP